MPNFDALPQNCVALSLDQINESLVTLFLNLGGLVHSQHFLYTLIQPSNIVLIWYEFMILHVLSPILYSRPQMRDQMTEAFLASASAKHVGHEGASECPSEPYPGSNTSILDKSISMDLGKWLIERELYRNLRQRQCRAVPNYRPHFRERLGADWLQTQEFLGECEQEIFQVIYKIPWPF